jgi:glycerol-3-phosphate dehydrogenase
MPPRWRVAPEKPPPPRAPTKAEKQERRDREEANDLIDCVLERAREVDAERRRHTWATMRPLADDGEPPRATGEARRIAWAKHGLTPPARRQRFDVYGNALH